MSQYFISTTSQVIEFTSCTPLWEEFKGYNFDKILKYYKQRPGVFSYWQDEALEKEKLLKTQDGKKSKQDREQLN